MDLIVGERYVITNENGYSIEGELTDIKWIGDQIYSIWIDIAREPVYVSWSNVKEIRLKNQS